MQEPDPRLVRAAVAGDVDAYGQLVRVYQEPVFRFLRQLVGDPSLAEDLAQEAFLRAFRRLDTFAFRSRFSTWLFQIARNAAIDALRRRDRRRGMLEAVAPRPHDVVPGPDLALEVEAAVATLSTKLREALLLVEVVGLTCAEAGEVLGIPEGTVKSRLFHARRQLVGWFSTGEEAADEV